MEKISFENQLLDAIKKDDVKSFDFLMPTNADLNICFGRFPLLSLMYLYSSYKLLAKFENKLMPIHNYKVVDEPIGLYKDFRKVAGKTLRFFTGDELVYPILMLAVLNEQIILKNRYKFLYKNANICSTIENIYNLNHEMCVDVDVNEIKIPSKKLAVGNYVLSGIFCFIFSVIFVLCSLVIPYVTNSNGIGSELKPIKISNAVEFQTALSKSDRHYIFENDITVSAGYETIEEFSGSLDGANFTLNIEGEIDSSFINLLSGSIKNLKIKLNNSLIKITQNVAIISTKNSGKIENCEILGNFTQEYNANEEVLIGLFSAENAGEISGCKTNVSGVMTNNKESNAYFGLFVGVNSGTGKIINCVAESGIVLADTVDLAGVAGQNAGLIKNTINKVKISQTSKKEWHPNVAGIAVSNYGSIEMCENQGDLSSKSEIEEINENLYYVFIGGMSCENFGNIVSCVNKGKIEGLGIVSNVVAAGISAQNIKNEDYEAVIKNSKFESSIFAQTQSGQTCVGGLVGINSSVVLNSGSVGSIEAKSDSVENKAVFMNEIDKPLSVVSGGLVGVNQNACVQNCYSNVSFVNTVESTDVLKIYSGSIGSVGMYKFRIWALISGADAYTQDYAGDALNYVHSNYYVANDSIKQCAFAIYGTLEQKNGGLYYKSGVAEALADNDLMKKCETFEEIPAEVRAYA